MENTDIETIIEKVLSSRKHINEITEIIEYISPEKDTSALILACEGVLKILTNYCETGDVLFINEESRNESITSVDVYKSWVGEKFTECYYAILGCFSKSDTKCLEVALTTSMQLLRLKALILKFKQPKSGEFEFPEKEFSDLLQSMLLCTNADVLVLLIPYFKYDDIRYFTLKALPMVLLVPNNIAEEKMHFIFVLLESIVHYMPAEGEELCNSYVFRDDLPPSFNQGKVFTVHTQRKMFSKAWLEFLKQPMSFSMHKKVLVILHTSLLPNFSKPRLLADFLIRSFNHGGGLALLGLHGLFVLMHQHNLEYPDFYKNLYSMLHPRIFDTKYKARFFYLLEVFLSSSHIPAYLVAAFVKKMSRLCLLAPPHVIQILLRLLLNLLRRHPNIRHLIHQTSKQILHCSVAEDPFKEHEADPEKSNALNSSLWEIRTLFHHYSPDIAKAAGIKSLGTQEVDASSLFDMLYQDLIDFEGIMSLNAMNPDYLNGIFGNNEDLVPEIWHI